MQIEWLYGFLETARLGSLSRAAEVLNMTQPALGKQIRNLEEAFGVKLFNRSPSGVELTPEGILLQERARPWLAEFDSLRADLANASRLQAVRVASLPSMAVYRLPPVLTDMHRQGIRTEMQVLPTSGEIIALLERGGADVGLVQRGPAVPGNYWCAELFREPFRVVVPSAHPLSGRNSVDLAMIQGETLVVYPPQCDVRGTIAQAYEAAGLVPNFGVVVAFGESIPGFVSSGAGISILPEIMAEHLPASLTALPLTGEPLARTLCLVSRKPELGRQVLRMFR